MGVVWWGRRLERAGVEGWLNVRHNPARRPVEGWLNVRGLRAGFLIVGGAERCGRGCGRGRSGAAVRRCTLRGPASMLCCLPRLTPVCSTARTALGGGCSTLLCSALLSSPLLYSTACTALGEGRTVKRDSDSNSTGYGKSISNSISKSTSKSNSKSISNGNRNKNRNRNDVVIAIVIVQFNRERRRTGRRAHP